MHSSRMRTARFCGHCEQNDWQTGVKTLPCPKLRLRAVINGYFTLERKLKRRGRYTLSESIPCKSDSQVYYFFLIYFLHFRHRLFSKAVLEWLCLCNGNGQKILSLISNVTKQLLSLNIMQNMSSTTFFSCVFLNKNIVNDHCEWYVINNFLFLYLP